MLAWSSLLWACATKGDAKAGDFEAAKWLWEAKDLAREGLRQMRRDRRLASESQKDFGAGIPRVAANEYIFTALRKMCGGPSFGLCSPVIAPCVVVF